MPADHRPWPPGGTHRAGTGARQHVARVRALVHPLYCKNAALTGRLISHRGHAGQASGGRGAREPAEPANQDRSCDD